MKITILALGSRGDVQPCVALGIGLQANGYQVTIASHDIFRKFVSEHGLAFTPVVGNPLEMLQGDAGKEWIGSGRNPIKTIRKMREVSAPLMVQLTEDCLHACEGADLILATILGYFPGPSIAEKLQIPIVPIYPVPTSPSREYASIQAPNAPNWMPFRGTYNVWSHYMYYLLIGWVFRPSFNEIRQKALDLPPFQKGAIENANEKIDILYSISPSVFPKPKDWYEGWKITGYWFLDAKEDWQPSAELMDFLSAGEAPVYIGFGSMTADDPEETTEIILQALQQSKQRGILLTGWAGIGNQDMPDDVFLLRNVPHAWLFPQMKAVVHHGGAGTTAAGLRAGVPSILVPHFGDQPYWGRQVERLGVGPKAIQRKNLTADGLAWAIEQASTDVALQQRAKSLGEAIRSEDGVGNAVEEIKRILNA